MSQDALPSPAETCYFVAGVDYGTQSDVIKAQLFDGEKSVGPPFFIQERLGLYDIPAQAAYHEGVLYAGRDLGDHLSGLKEPNIPYDKVIQFAKLALYEHSKGSPMASCVKRVGEQLACHGKSLDEFLADHLAALINKGRDFLVEHPLLRFFPQDRIRSLPWHVRLTVPHSWSPSACARMQNAARKAGIKVTSLASEPECAVASSIDLLSGQKVPMPIPLIEQSRILCADLGCGTADYTLVELTDALAVNSKLKVLKETGDPLGGSQGINERLLATYERSLGDEDAVREKAESLGSDLAAFRWFILGEIERHKMDFPVKSYYPIVFYHADGRLEFYVFSEAEMQDAFNSVVSEVERCIDEYVNDQALRPDLIFVSGGFGKSRYLDQRLRARFQDIQVLTPFYYNSALQETLIAEGALSSRYGQLSTQTIPPRYSYAVLRDEEYEPSVHVDAWVMKNQKRMPIDGVVYRSEWNPKRRFVLQRMLPFLNQGDSVTTTDINVGVPVSYYMRAHGKLHLKAEFVFIDEEKLHPFMKFGSATELAFEGGSRGPAFEKDGKTLRPGVTPWKKTVHVLKLSKDQLSFFNQVLDTNETLWYEVPAQLCVKYRSEKDMVMTWRLLPPYGQPIEVEEMESLLWDAEHSEFLENPVSDLEDDGEE
ncbi:hypothetical protein D0867_00211 [Hortaea werneckii]|uniref:Uncharacterized protein n=1 Tax=Hortaea werneckii TaxID=91943 RepID=A0A3M7BPY7_HORWE|nr:hypothetical protein D0867_00211 [Hortaea werneckii]RMY41716.1 hypothetical protein D0866_00404 [Hortaea werneckii]